MAIQFSEIIKQGGGTMELGVLDPSSTGVIASVSTIGASTDGKVWIKYGVTNTDWTRIPLIDVATGKIEESDFPDLVILGLRQGTRAEFDSLIGTEDELLINEPAWETDTEVFRVGSVRFTADEATESSNGYVEWATQAEVDAADQTTTEAVARAKHMRIRVETANGNAMRIGSLDGDARGNGSVTLQASRSATTQVASGQQATAIGTNSLASGGYATAIGTGATASGGIASGNVAIGRNATASSYSGDTAIGYTATASGSYSTAVGYWANASGYSSTVLGNNASATKKGTMAVGFVSTASGEKSGAVGYRATTTIDNSHEFGYWSDASTRAGAVRVHGTGYVALSTPESDTAFTDGGATAGSEADGTLMRSGLAFRVNTSGNLIATYCDASGTITSVDLGAMS